MADGPLSCRVCGIELADVPASPLTEWPVANCPACGEVAVVCRGHVLCSACGIEYHCETAWLEGGVPVAKCPTCGSTAAIRHPEPPPPPRATPVAPEPAAEPDRPTETPTTVPPPVWAPPPWTPSPWPAPWPPEVPPSAERVAAMWAAERVTGIVILLFVVACFLPSFRLGNKEYQLGIFGLLCGWITCIFWLPNPLLFFGCRGLLSGHFRYAFTLGILACIGTLPVFAISGSLDNLSWGFYVWQGDIVFFTIAAGVLCKRYGPDIRESGGRR